MMALPRLMACCGLDGSGKVENGDFYFWSLAENDLTTLVSG